MKPQRIPSEEEEMELAKLFADEDDPNDEEVTTMLGFITNAAVSVHDEYITDGPGYSGQLIMICWPGGPELYDCVIRDSKTKQLKIVDRDECCQREGEVN